MGKELTVYSRMILSDISRSKTITAVTVLFIAASAALTALAGTLVVNLSGAIDDLMNRAKSPHYMQMHSGDLDAPGLAAFAAAVGDRAIIYGKEFSVAGFLRDSQRTRYWPRPSASWSTSPTTRS